MDELREEIRLQLCACPPLAALACNACREAVERVFDAIWRNGWGLRRES